MTVFNNQSEPVRDLDERIEWSEFSLEWIAKLSGDVVTYVMPIPAIGG